MKQRLAKLRALLDEEGLNALFVTSPVEDLHRSYAANRRYLSGFTGSVGHLLITKDAAFIAVDFRYYEQAQQEAAGFQLFPANDPLPQWLPKLLTEAGIKKLGFNPHEVTYARYREIAQAISGMPAGERPKLLTAPLLVERLRARKEPEELELIQRAVDLADEAFQAVAQRLEPGWTERQGAQAIEDYFRAPGRAAGPGGPGIKGGDPSFETIVAAGPNASKPHHQPTDQPIGEGEPVIIDMGARIDGYCSDLSRTIVLGRPDDRFRVLYDIVLGAQLTAEALVRPGMTGEEAHMLAYSFIAEAGYGEHFGHGLGHGVGLQVHEAPRLARTSKDTLQEGMVFTVEPGIYIPGWGGIRIEDMVVLEDGKVRVLSRAPKVERIA